MSISLRILIVLMIFFTATIAYFIWAPQSSSPRAGATNVAPATLGLSTRAGIVKVLVLDNNEVAGVSLEEVLKGEDLILVYKPSPTAADAAQEIFLFHSMRNLTLLDSNPDGFLDSTDERYKNLYLASLDVEQRLLRYTHINKLGIASIIFEPDYIEAELRGDAGRFGQVAATVVMEDSSRWKLKVLLMEARWFANLTLLEVGSLN